MQQSTVGRIAVIGNYLPRRCGIATFTTHLCENLAAAFPCLNVMAVPVNDTAAGYDYPQPVRFVLQQNDLASYRSAADFLNINKIDAVCVQHEFGIYGGTAGSHLLSLMRDLRMPIITTLHTIPREPDATLRRVLEEVASLSDRLVVMSQTGRRFLEEVYTKIPSDKIDCIPHGVPDVPFTDPSYYKDQFGVEGRFVLLTFGLLGPGKGIEHVIRALPEIVKRYPNVVYLVLGATHPALKRTQGEAYRISLQQLAQSLEVDDHVLFHNRFVTETELLEYIGAADVYITPYLNREQITSGTLAYCAGAGKAIISTPYWHAEELLAEDRGVLVPFADPPAVAASVIDLLDNESKRHAMRKRIYLHARDAIWPQSVRRYMDSFHRAVDQRRQRPRPAPAGRSHAEDRRQLPPIDLQHLRRITDDAGILQHAVFIAPNYNEGYTTDDNARALVVTALLDQLGEDADWPVMDLASRYLAFLWHAFNEKTGHFRNFLAYDRRWCEECGSEDSQGRAIWALGMVVGRSSRQGLRGMAARLLDMSLPAATQFRSPRAVAFTLIGLAEYDRRFPGDRAFQEARRTLAEWLLDLHQRSRRDDWPWFEDVLSYANAKLPHALLQAGRALGRDDMITASLESLEWLTKVQRGEAGQFVPIGAHGWYPRGSTRARFDQQPIEAHATISACLEAYDYTAQPHWRKEARRAFDWFLGRNDLQVPLFDATTGGCYDGLHAHSVNQNQGAESTLAFLMSLLELRLLEATVTPVIPSVPNPVHVQIPEVPTHEQPARNPV